MSQLCVILKTCDKFIHLVEGVMYGIEKYWVNHPKIYLLGYSEPKFKLKNNWEFISFGVDSGPNDWSNVFIKFFSDNDFTEFLLFYDDMFFLGEVDDTQIKRLHKILTNDKDIGKISLCGTLSTESDYYNGEVENEHGYDIVNVKQNMIYRLSSQPAIWNVDYFLRYLKPNMDPWKFELQHPTYDGVKIYSVRTNRPVSLSHFYRKGGEIFLHDKWYVSWTDDKIMTHDDKLMMNKILNFKVDEK